jgi:hypothetical protein
MDFENEVKEHKEKAETKKPTQKILPLKDFIIKHNGFYYEIKQGEEIEIDKKFLANLKTEKVIK